jgi:hypothetical protein
VQARARQLLREAFEADRYSEALRLADVLMETFRKKGDRGQMTRLQKERPALEGAHEAFREAAAAAQQVKRNPADAAANQTVGKYLCFVKNEWQRGLPHLRQATDIKLRVLAAVDLESARSGPEAYSLAEQYWDLAQELKQPFSRGLELRAAYYYQQAVGQMEGLEKVKAQQRLQTIRQTRGVEEVDRALGSLVPSAGAAK